MSKVSFMEDLTQQMKTKKQLSDSSIQAYLRNLRKLNGDEVFKNFNFLKDIEVIQRRLDGYKENTKRNYLISIVSVLSLSDKPLIKKLHDKYYSLMMKKNEEINKEVNPNDLTETQEKNWMSWEEVKKTYLKLEKDVDSFVKLKNISEQQYNTLLSYTILSLYIHQAPRRNKDYQIMKLVPEYKPELVKESNYLDTTKKQFIFNSYKTSSKYGTQIVNISDELWKALQKYFEHHPLLKSKDKNDIVDFLVYPNKQPLDKVNSITRILNKIFEKSIGSSMLRHIYLTGKYGKTLEDQKKDASDMAHSHGQQKDYIKKPKSIIVQL
jgi:DNA-binding protein Fis